MKTIKKTAVFFLIASIVIVSACKKEKREIAYPEENPMSSYINMSGFTTLQNTFINNSYYEFGLQFTPLVNGKIVSIVAKLPDANNSLRVTIWDVETKLPLRTETVNIANANQEFTFNISPLNLQKDKQYFITMNSNDWYHWVKADNSIAAYPFMVGNINITSYAFANGSAQTYPNNAINLYYAGNLSFKFQQLN